MAILEMTRRWPVTISPVAALCGSAFLLLLSPRLSALLLFAALLLALASPPSHRRKKLVAGIWGAYLLAVLLPIDIGLSGQPGFSPRLVPVVYGYPGPELWDLETKGEAVLGGCVVFLNSPTWMLLF